jgi:hypothetical protein
MFKFIGQYLNVNNITLAIILVASMVITGCNTSGLESKEISSIAGIKFNIPLMFNEDASNGSDEESYSYYGYDEDGQIWNVYVELYEYTTSNEKFYDTSKIRYKNWIITEVKDDEDVGIPYYTARVNIKSSNNNRNEEVTASLCVTAYYNNSSDCKKIIDTIVSSMDFSEMYWEVPEY